MGLLDTEITGACCVGGAKVPVDGGREAGLA